MRRTPCIILITMLWLGAPGESRATTLRGLDLDALCHRSEHILRGEVIDLAPQWRAGRIYTAVTLRVAGALAGPSRPGDRVTFWRLGGEVGGIGQRVAGAAQFRRGERVLVFLHSRRGRLFVTGMVQGKVKVLPAQVPGGARRVRSAVGRFHLRGGRHPLRVPTTLAAFEAQVRARVQARRRPAPRRHP